MKSACVFLSVVGLTILTHAQKVTYGPDSSQPVSSTEAARHIGGSRYSTRFDDITWDNEAWTLTTTTARPHDYHASAYTANGYFGASMASIGPFFQYYGVVDGWPVFNQRLTFGTVSGFFDRQPKTNGSNYPWLYEQGWDSVISGIPNWGPLIMEMADGSYLAANTSLDELSNIQLTQDYKRGLAQWQYTWAPSNPNGLKLNVTYMAFAHKLHVNQGYVLLNVTSSKDCNMTVYNVLDGRSAVRTRTMGKGTDGDMIYSAVSPNGVENVTAWVYSAVTTGDGGELGVQSFNGSKPFLDDNTATAAQTVSFSLSAGKPGSLLKHVGVASTDAFTNPQNTAKMALLSSRQSGFSQIAQSHEQEWISILNKNSVVDYADPSGTLPAVPALIEKTVASVVSAFSLLMNTISQNALKQVSNAPVNIHGISVCGLTSDCYGGQRFWDQDIWMHPMLSTVFPEAAKQIPNARLQQYPQAKANVKTAFTSSQAKTYFSDNAAVYPWTSGRDANCTATGPCFDYEYHINGDIVHSFINQWTSSGDESYMKESLFPIMNSVATFYSELLTKNGSGWGLINMTDPDEYSNNVNNGGFTMPLIASVLNMTNTMAGYFGQPTNDTWSSQAENVIEPRAGDLTLEYASMNGSLLVKQADVVLKIYPLLLGNDYTISQQQADLDYYAAHSSPDGPGMTYAIFSIAANAISPSGCSVYSYDQYSWSPYLRAPWFGFSEQLIDDPSLNGGTNPAFPFLTGHGGFMQVDIFGYLGLRRDTDWTLYVSPSLPPQIPQMTYPTIFHHGWPIRASSNQTHTTLTRSGNALSTANQTFADSGIPVILTHDSSSSATTQKLMLMPNKTLTLSNRQYANNKTEPGNILQCQPVTSPSDTQPGLFAIAAVDGAASTVWQPQTSDTQSLTVDISSTPFQELKYAYFDWAQAPPKQVTIALHNYTDSTMGQIINVTNIKISKPYDPKTAGVIVPYAGNTTKIELKQGIWSSNFVTLMIEGNQANSSKGAVGATVAEFALGA